MASSFLFIDYSKNDNLTKSLARSHVLKGKNAGRKLKRRSGVGLRRFPEGKLVTALLKSESAVTHEMVPSYGKDLVPSIRLKGSLLLSYFSLNDYLFTVAFPLEHTLRSQHLVKQFYGFVFEALYPPRLCRSLDKVRSYWLQKLFEDPMSYHCTIALMASMDSFFSGRDDLPPIAVYHLGCAVNLVNMKLATAEALSDTTLAVVNFLVVQHLIREEHAQAEVHYKGLQKMVELRGGLSQLAHDEILAVKLCKTDLDYALHYGTSTYFYRDRMSEIYRLLTIHGIVISNERDKLPSTLNDLNPFLRQVLQDVMNICSLFNDERLDFRIEPNTLQEFVVSVGHRVVLNHPLSDLPLENKVEGAYHIGLVAFVTTLILQFGRRHYLKFGLVGQCLRDVITLGLDKEHDGIMLWLLFIGGVSALGDMGCTWLGAKIRQKAIRLGLSDWADLRSHLVQYPWIGAVHDEGGKILWESAIKDQAH